MIYFSNFLNKLVVFSFMATVLYYFLVAECNNSIENISNSMMVMIFSSIKSLAGRGLNQNITKCLKVHLSLTNCLIIKSFTTFGKQIYFACKRNRVTHFSPRYLFTKLEIKFS